MRWYPSTSPNLCMLSIVFILKLCWQAEVHTLDKVSWPALLFCLQTCLSEYMTPMNESTLVFDLRLLPGSTLWKFPQSGCSALNFLHCWDNNKVHLLRRTVLYIFPEDLSLPSKLLMDSSPPLFSCMYEHMFHPWFLTMLSSETWIRCF